MHAHITYRNEDAEALRAAGVQGEVIALNDDLSTGPLDADLESWPSVRAQAAGSDQQERSALQEHYRKLVGDLHDAESDASRIIWAGPDFDQQRFVAFMMSVIPDSLESGEPLRLVELAKAPADCDPSEIQSADPSAIDDMQVRMAANVWQCIIDDMRIPAAELAKMVEEQMPAFARAMIAWADDES